MITSEEVMTERFGVLEVTALLPDAGGLSVARIGVSGENRRLRNTKSDSAYYVISGTGAFVLDGREIPVAAGDLVFIPRGQVYQDRGELDLLAVSSPPFDASAVEYLD